MSTRLPGQTCTCVPTCWDAVLTVLGCLPGIQEGIGKLLAEVKICAGPDFRPNQREIAGNPPHEGAPATARRWPCNGVREALVEVRRVQGMTLDPAALGRGDESHADPPLLDPGLVQVLRRRRAVVEQTEAVLEQAHAQV